MKPLLFILALTVLVGCGKDAPQTKPDYSIVDDWKSGNIKPEDGYLDQWLGCCKPENYSYLVFAYPNTPKPKDFLGTWPGTYEIRYFKNGDNERIYWFGGDLMRTDLTYKEYLQSLIKRAKA